MLCISRPRQYGIFVFFFNDTATTEIYTLSLHDALPISVRPHAVGDHRPARTHGPVQHGEEPLRARQQDRKSTRLNSSHQIISYAVFCLKKKKLQRLRTEILMHQERPSSRETSAHARLHS